MTKIIGAGGGGCFTGGTYIRTPDGACLIEKLKEAPDSNVATKEELEKMARPIEDIPENEAPF